MESTANLAEGKRILDGMVTGHLLSPQVESKPKPTAIDEESYYVYESIEKTLPTLDVDKYLAENVKTPVNTTARALATQSAQRLVAERNDPRLHEAALHAELIRLVAKIERKLRFQGRYRLRTSVEVGAEIVRLYAGTEVCVTPIRTGDDYSWELSLLHSH